MRKPPRLYNNGRRRKKQAASLRAAFNRVEVVGDMKPILQLANRNTKLNPPHYLVVFSHAALSDQLTQHFYPQDASVWGFASVITSVDTLEQFR